MQTSFSFFFFDVNNQRNFLFCSLRSACTMALPIVIRAAFFIYLSLDECAAWLYRGSASSSYGYHHGTATGKMLSRQLPWHAVIPQSEPSAFDVEQLDRNGNTAPSKSEFTKTMDIANNIDGSETSKYDQPTNRQQLWLDLRDTALFPKEAIRFIHDQCCQSDGNSSSKHLIDAVLVSSSSFDRIIAPTSETNTNKDDDWYRHALYYTTHDTTPEQLVLHEATTQQSIPIGTVVCCSEKDKTDLDVVALSEQIIKQQKWVFVQETTTSTTTKSVSKYMMKQLTDFIQFLSSSSNRIIMMNMDENNYQVTTSGLFLAPDMNTIVPMTESIAPQQFASNNEDLSLIGDNSRSISNSGGVAIVCSDRTSFVAIDAMLAEFRQLESIGTTTTTLSGITIPSILSENNGSVVQQQQSPFVTALVLPLDVSIWETVYNHNDRYMQNNNDP
jgi:hypothetical protein